MPFTSRLRLLAGVAALLGLGTACAGCQSTTARSNLYAIRNASAGPAPMEAVTAPPRPRTAVMAAADFAPHRDFKPMAPVRAGGGDRTVVASTWQTDQRGNADHVGGTAQPIAQTPAPLSVVAAGAKDMPPAQAVLPSPQAVLPSPQAGLPPPLPLGTEVMEGTPSHAAEQPRLVPEPAVAAPVAEHPLHHPPVPREDAKQPFPEYRVEPPDILLIQGSKYITLPIQALDGPHLVRPDGTISLGIYGTVYVAGLTLEEIRDAVAARLKTIRDQARGAREERDKIRDDKGEVVALHDLAVERIKLELTVDVLAYNSKVYYVITDGGGYGEQVYSFVATGNETILDALARINGLPAVASKKRIWLARATPAGVAPKVLPVDWRSITQMGVASANYQVFPGDRIYVNSDKLIRTDSFLSKTLAPVERLLGVTLLGSSTVNSIRNANTTGTGTGLLR